MYLFSEDLVVPQLPSIIIPSPGDVDLDESTALICGIVPDTTEYTPTWTTPGGDSLTPADVAINPKYTIQNGRIGPNFPQGSVLAVMRLSYLDSGNYTCSIAFTGGPNAGTTHTARIELSLVGKYTVRN